MAKSQTEEQFPRLAAAVRDLFYATIGTGRYSMLNAQLDTYVLALAEFPESDALAAIDKLKRKAGMRQMPVLGDILSLLGKASGPSDVGVDMDRAFAWRTDEMTGQVVTLGNPKVVKHADRRAIIEHCERCGDNPSALLRAFDIDPFEDND